MSTPAKTTRVVDLLRVRELLARLAAHLEQHPQIADRTARWLESAPERERPAAGAVLGELRRRYQQLKDKRGRRRMRST